MEPGFRRAAAAGDLPLSPSHGAVVPISQRGKPAALLSLPGRRPQTLLTGALLVVSLLLTLVGCANAPEQAAATPTGAYVNNLAVGLTLDEQSRVIDPTGFFRPDASAIQVSFDASNVSREVKVDVEWTYANAGQVIKRESQDVTGDKHMSAALSKPAEGDFPLGDYSVAVLIDRAESGRIVFSVRAPEPAESDMRVQNVVTGMGLDSEQRIQQPTTSFKPDTLGIFLSAEVVNVTGEANVSIQWVYIPTNDAIDSVVQKATGDTRVGFSLNRPQERTWPTGHYKVVVFLNGKPSSGGAFTVYP